MEYKVRVLSILFLMTMWAFPSLKAENSNRADIRLVDSIAVRVPNVTLGEIASIETENNLLKMRLINLVVGEPPRVSGSKIISSFKIKSILTREGIRNVDVHGIQSTVVTETRFMEKDELKKIIQKWVLSKSEENNEADIDFLRLSRRWEVPKGKEVEFIVHSRKASHSGGKLALTVRAVVGDFIMASTHVRIDLKYFSNAPVLIRPLLRGEKLLEEYVEIHRSDVTSLDSMIVGNAENVFGMIAKKDLPLGKILSLKDFEMPVLIERGSMNRLLVVNGIIKMSIAGAKALQSGKKGELILFSNPLNGKETLKGRVMRTGLAMINLN
jgi:flagella basal body P-ring formation protein FlgA